MENQFAITVGLPLSGKSTYCRNLMGQGKTIVSPDNIRLALYGNQFIASSEPYVWAITITMTKSLIMSGHDVILDATNINKQSRLTWLNVAKELGIPITAIVIDTPYEICLFRNEQLGARFPADVITRMYNQLELPTYEEGYSKVFHVSLSR